MKAPLIVLVIFFSSKVLAQTDLAGVPEKTEPIILGMAYHIHSEALQEDRILNIYLPDGYKQDDSTRYPVIYLLDGSVDEDFVHVAGLVQFNSTPWVNRVPPSIVVGIANVNRQRDFTFPTTVDEDRKKFPATGHSDKFIAFMENELEPYIDHTFKTTRSRTLIGESLGGLLATEILLKKPALFNEYIIVSPSLWWDNASLLTLPSAVLQDTFTQKISVYIGVGKEGLAPTTVPHVMEVEANQLADRLRGTKSKGLQVYYDYLPQENHATIEHQAIYNAFRLLNAGADK